jgi:hypothetical protein
MCPEILINYIGTQKVPAGYHKIFSPVKQVDLEISK